MPSRGGKWSGRPNLGQIEEQAVKKIAEFRRKLQSAGLSVPEIPPVPVDYIALTLTTLSVRGIEGLAFEGKPLAGLLDIERTEILYEETNPPGRQNFTIGHELGHYFLHYLPAVAAAQQPTLFDGLESPLSSLNHLERADHPAARFFRCSEKALIDGKDEENPAAPETELNPLRTVGRCQLEDPATKAQLAKIIRLKELADRTEWEANIFARGLLMPTELVRWLNKKYAGDIGPMAAELGVTQTALRYRLNGLGLRQDENMGLGSQYSPARPKSADNAQQGTFF